LARGDRIERTLRWLTLALVALFAFVTAAAAVIVPYRIWDSLAFGAWSRSIAATGDVWRGASPLSVSRPLFYVPQGLAWRWVTDGEWLGRLLSAAFAALLVWSVWALARRLSESSDAHAFVPPLAVGALLTSAVLATYAAAGMTDVPVAATSAATAVALWSRRGRRLILPLAALGAAATLLAKPSGLLALGGLFLATIVLRRREGFWAVLVACAGALVALAYDAWQASRFDVSLATLLRAGNDDFWLARGRAARLDTLVAAGWLGDGTRLVVAFALVYGIARVVGLRTSWGLAAGAGAAVIWSVAGPLAATGDLGYPFRGSVLGIVAWLVLAGAMVAAPFLAVDDPVPRPVYAALLVWAAPIALVWASQRPDEPRLLAPAWPPLALLAGTSLAAVSLALLRLRPAASLIPAGALAVAVLANLVSVDGLGRQGWHDLLELGPSGWRDRAQLENFAYGPFSYELDLARENVGPGERLVSSDGRLAYFFPDRVEVAYARTCAELEGARFFSFLSSGESLQLAQLDRQPTNPLGWLQCRSPRVHLVGEQEGIYAAYVVGPPPARAPTGADCHIASTPGTLVDGVFGAGLSYADAAALVKRALAVGFQGTRIERTGCSAFRVVVTGIPDDARVQKEFAAQAARVGLPVVYAAAQRYPEVSPDIPAVR